MIVFQVTSTYDLDLLLGKFILIGHEMHQTHIYSFDKILATKDVLCYLPFQR